MTVPAHIFRKYDIRGDVYHELTEEHVFQIAQAIGTKMRSVGQRMVIIGRDGRLSGPVLSQALSNGLRSTGCDVIDIGMVPSPVLYFATHTLETRSGVMLTGSHNPPEYNGLKILIDGKTLSGEEIYELYEIWKKGELTEGSGSYRQHDVREAYVARIAKDIHLKRPLKVVVDSGNGVTGELAPKVMRAIGCEVIELFTDIDGHFPNHHPDPLKPENLEDIAHKVRETKADIGLAFDGDGDRLGVVSNLGNIIWADRVLMLLSVGVLKACPEATILYDVKCTRFLADVIESAGGKAVMSATGHSIMKRNLALTGAELGGELSGHIFFKHRWYGFDDGVYAGARLLELLTEESVDADTVFSRFPDGVSTPELNVLIPESEKFGLIDRLQQEAQARFPTAKIITLDGMRIEFSNGWALVRASNTTPNLVLRFEATTPEELKSIQDAVRDWIKAVAPQLILGF